MRTTEFSIGDTVTHTYVVGQEDIASFQGEVVHEVCATFTLAREIEYASRLFVLAMKEPDEEGIGTELSIVHRSPAFPGEKLTILARLEKLTREDVICRYEVRVGSRLVALGTTGQKVYQKEKIHAHFDRIKGSTH